MEKEEEQIPLKQDMASLTLQSFLGLANDYICLKRKRNGIGRRNAKEALKEL